MHRSAKAYRNGSAAISKFLSPSSLYRRKYLKLLKFDPSEVSTFTPGRFYSVTRTMLFLLPTIRGHLSKFAYSSEKLALTTRPYQGRQQAVFLVSLFVCRVFESASIGTRGANRLCINAVKPEARSTWIQRRDKEPRYAQEGQNLLENFLIASTRSIRSASSAPR